MDKAVGCNLSNDTAIQILLQMREHTWSGFDDGFHELRLGLNNFKADTGKNGVATCTALYCTRGCR